MMMQFSPSVSTGVREAAVRGVVLEQVGVGRQVAGRVDGDDVEFVLQALLPDRAQGAATDTTKTVNSNLDSHESFLLV
jgi:hypothetical protein